MEQITKPGHDKEGGLERTRLSTDVNGTINGIVLCATISGAIHTANADVTKQTSSCLSSFIPQ